MNIKIKVTKEIYQRAMMCGVSKAMAVVSEHCAIALAVRDIAPHALVTGSLILWDSRFYLNGEKYYIPLSKRKTSELPKEAIKMIAKFDQTAPKNRPSLPEFSFEVDFPNALVKQIGIEEVKEILERSETLEAV